MAIIVEDGSGKSDAESYATVAFCDDYFSKRNITTWAALDTATKEANLRKSTEYMVAEYRNRWLGRRVLTTQALDWPRVGVVIQDFKQTQFTSYGLFQIDWTIVPIEVQRACAELALKIQTIPTLAPDQPQAVTEETVGPITVKYDKDSSSIVQYRQVDLMLKVYLVVGDNSSVQLRRC